MKKNSFFCILLFILTFSFSSCDLLENQELSEEEIVSGLKTALQMGSENACADLNEQNGYFNNPLVKILLPEEADIIFSVLNDPIVQSLGLNVELQKHIDSVVLAINRSAEDVADDAKPIFVNAITNLTISDGINILQGKTVFNQSKDSATFDSIAATHYMEFMTRNDLYALYEPKINESLSKDLGLGFTANDAWATLLWFYNNYIVILGYQAIEEVNLSTFCANKGLDGLFLFVGNQEKAIRKDPYTWANDILEKVFGYVYVE